MRTDFVFHALGTPQERSANFPHPGYRRGPSGSPISASFRSNELIFGSLRENTGRVSHIAPNPIHRSPNPTKAR